MLQQLLRSTSLTAKMTMATILMGMGVWFLLDVLQTPRLIRAFVAHHHQEFEHDALLDRALLDETLNKFQALAELTVTRAGFAEYLFAASSNWSEQPILHASRPPWLPGNTLLRAYPLPRVWMVLDESLSVKEIYSTLETDLPPALRTPSPLLVSLGDHQHYLQQIHELPYLITTRRISYHNGLRIATLLLATPLDNHFLSAMSHQQHQAERVTVLVDLHQGQRVIASSNPARIPDGSLLDEHLDGYALAGLATLDYGDSELLLAFGSLFSRQELKSLVDQVLVEEHRARWIAGMTLLGTFWGVMMVLIHRITWLNRTVAEFFQRELAEPMPPANGRDQLAIFEERFIELTRRVKITHRTLLEKARELEAVVANVADGIIVIDEESRIESMNPAALHLFGFSRNAAPLSLTSLMPDDMRRQHQQGIRRWLATHQSHILDKPIEVPGLRADGSACTLDLRISVMPWHHGHRFIGIVRDVTERKQAELALMASEARYRTLVETIPHGVEECDTQGVVTLNNPARYRMLELNADPWPGRTIFDSASTPAMAAQLRHYFFELVEKQPPPSPYIDQNRTASGKIIDIQVDWNYKRDGQGRLVGFVAIITDITEKMAAAKRIREQQESLAHVQRLQTMGEIASGIAHELNQPLAAILNYARGCSRRLRSGTWDFQEILAVIDRIGEQAERVGLVMQNLRGFLSKGKASSTLVELTRVVRDAVEFMDYETRRQGVAVRFRTDDQDHLVFADTIQIQQVIQNLMRNGIEAMLEAGVALRILDVTLQARDNAWVELTICDTGPGVDPRLKSDLFCPFFTTKPDGMGLGLSISQSIIEHHGGRLWQENLPAGGALFGIQLPLGRRMV